MVRWDFYGRCEAVGRAWENVQGSMPSYEREWEEEKAGRAEVGLKNC